MAILKRLSKNMRWSLNLSWLCDEIRFTHAQNIKQSLEIGTHREVLKLYKEWLGVKKLNHILSCPCCFDNEILNRLTTELLEADDLAERWE